MPPDLEATPLPTGRPAAVLPASHPLTARTEVTVDDLRAERFVAMRSGYLMHRFGLTTAPRHRRRESVTAR